MSPNKWGPPTWMLFHTLAEKIKEEKFSQIAVPLFSLIKKICSVLPCPECSMHATQFLSRVQFQYIKTKTDFKLLFYAFHNIVNIRKKKPLFNVANLNSYANVNLVSAYNGFVSVNNTRGNMKLLADSFQRNLIMKEFKNWFIANFNNFNP